MARRERLLPQLRPDLEITKGPVDEDGSPTYVIFDPLANRYFHLGWAEKEIAARMVRPRVMSELLKQLQAETTLQPTEEEVARFWSGMTRSGLTLGGMFRDVEGLAASADGARKGRVLTLFRSYLYYRKHLFHPDAFLAKALPYVRHLASPWFLLAAAIIFGVGLALVVQRWEAYWATFNTVLNASGLLAYVVTITLVKVVHEFAHAFTAKACGLRVPSMGVAFILLWPLLYSDVSASWRLAQRRKRLAVSVAGVLAELVIAGLALFGWAVSQEGSLAQKVFFILSSASVASSLLINLNPVMKFDGYFLLMDLLGVDNLQARAFAYTRWLYRWRLLGIDAPCPEGRASRRRRAALVAYACSTWAYRLFLYMGIALLAYFQLTKTLGILFFGLALWAMLLRPISHEIREVAGGLKDGGISWRPIAWGLALLLLFSYLALPLPRLESFPAVKAPYSDQVVYAPSDGFLRDLAVEREQQVQAGQTLARIEVPELDVMIRDTDLRIKSLAHERDLMRLSARLKGDLQAKEEEIKQLGAELSRFKSLADRNVLTVDFNGIAYDWDKSLRSGMAIAKDRVLGRIALPNRAKVVAYVPERWIGLLDQGDRPVFVPDNQADPVACRITSISPAFEETLPYPALASPYGGNLDAVVGQQGEVRLVKTYFALELEPMENAGQSVVSEQRGRVKIYSRPYSLVAQWLRQLQRALIRETSF